MAVIAVIVVGLAARIGLLQLAPAHGFFTDQLDFVIWSEWAYRNGPTSLYDLPAKTLMNARLPDELSPRGAIAPFPGFNIYNYPPLANYVMTFQGWLLNMVDSREVTRRVSPEIAEFAGVPPGLLRSPVANTVTTRAVIALLPTVADFLMAWGAAVLVAGLRKRRPGWAEIGVFAVVALAPPFMLNSALWGQVDSIVTCLVIWCLAAIIRERYGWAGAAYAGAVTFKAQAILVAPVLLFVLVALERRDGWRRAGAVLGRFAAAGLAVAALVIAPHAVMCAGGPGGGWLRWYYHGYVIPIQHQFQATTLRAFNVWWLDYLLHGQAAHVLDLQSTVAGLTRLAWGYVMLVGAMLLSAAACVKRWGWKPAGWVAMAALIPLAAFLFATRAHERYVYYCLPFFIVISAILPRWWPATVALLLVGSFEMTWYLWLAPALSAPGAPLPPSDAVVGSLVLAVLAVASFVYALVALLPWRRAPAATPAPRQSVSLFAERGE